MRIKEMRIRKDLYSDEINKRYSIINKMREKRIDEDIISIYRMISFEENHFYTKFEIISINEMNIKKLIKDRISIYHLEKDFREKSLREFIEIYYEYIIPSHRIYQISRYFEKNINNFHRKMMIK